jgi:hypothetical protein
MASEEEVKTLTAQCFCKAVHFTVSIPVKLLPLNVHLCHCEICRYTHGTLCTFHASLPKGIEPQFIAPSSLANIAGYKHRNAIVERFFCTTCGCHVGDHDLEPDPETGMHEWRVATPVFDTHAEDVFRISSHCLTNETVGGGFYDFLPALGDRTIKVWNPEPGSGMMPLAGKNTPPKQEFDAAGNERLRVECHCGGVSFTVPRPSVPEVAGDESLKKWISPLEPNKWAACLDVCDDCRLMDGTHVVAWTFVPLELTEPRVPDDLLFGTLSTYASSQNVLRGFCGVCGATVFFTCEEDRKMSDKWQMVDISVGVIRAPEGTLAETWLTWRTARMSWMESGLRYDPLFTESLAKGLDDWGRKQYGESPDFRIG